MKPNKKTSITTLYNHEGPRNHWCYHCHTEWPLGAAPEWCPNGCHFLEYLKPTTITMHCVIRGEVFCHHEHEARQVVWGFGRESHIIRWIEARQRRTKYKEIEAMWWDATSQSFEWAEIRDKKTGSLLARLGAPASTLEETNES